MGYWPSLFGQDGWILASFFFREFMDLDSVSVHKLAKKRTWPISSHLDRTSLVNKGFIIWLSGKFFLRDTAGSQSQRRIWFILPARGACHMIKCLFSELVPIKNEKKISSHAHKTGSWYTSLGFFTKFPTSNPILFIGPFLVLVLQWMNSTIQPINHCPVDRLYRNQRP